MPSTQIEENNILSLGVKLRFKDKNYEDRDFEEIRRLVIDHLRSKVSTDRDQDDRTLIYDFLRTRLQIRSIQRGVFIYIADYEEYSGSLIIGFTIIAVGQFLASGFDIKTICEELVERVGADFGQIRGLGLTTEINNHQRLGNTINNARSNPPEEFQFFRAQILSDFEQMREETNAIIQSIQSSTQEVNSKLKTGLNYNIIVTAFCLILGGLAFYFYSEKSDLEEKMEVRKQVTDYLTEINTFKESGMRTPVIKKDSNLVSKEKPKKPNKNDRKN